MPKVTAYVLYAISWLWIVGIKNTDKTQVN